MKKIKFNIEYPLNNASLSILWNSIGTPLGLSEWFADGVTVIDNEYIFCWEKHEQAAKLQQLKQHSFIRFQWNEDEGTDYYFELKMTVLEITGELTLIVTDFAEPAEVSDTILLWNKQIEQLRRKTGM
ncbi:MAG: START-like domain-containing protein [Paludibacter sp.]